MTIYRPFFFSPAVNSQYFADSQLHFSTKEGPDWFLTIAAASQKEFAIKDGTVMTFNEGHVSARECQWNMIDFGLHSYTTFPMDL